MYGVETIREMIYKYAGETWFVGIFLICGITLYLRADQIRKKYIIAYTVGGILILTPFFQKIIQALGGDAERYRFLWLFPIVLVIAGWMVKAISEQKGKIEQTVVLLVMIGVVFVSGNTYLTADNLNLPENIYGIPDETVLISDIIEDTKEEAYVVAALEGSLQLTIRQYNPFVIWGIVRNTYMTGEIARDSWDELTEGQREEQMLMLLVSKGEVFDVDAMKKCLRDKGIDFLVINKMYAVENYMEELSCKNVGETEQHVVYKVDYDG